MENLVEENKKLDEIDEELTEDVSSSNAENIHSEGTFDSEDKT